MVILFEYKFKFLSVRIVIKCEKVTSSITDDPTIQLQIFPFKKILPFVILGEKCDIFETNKQQAYPRSTALFVSFGVHAST